jgi:4-amino-4-deoxy-L-arabinose transferase-like glycosyltransferase
LTVSASTDSSRSAPGRGSGLLAIWFLVVIAALFFGIGSYPLYDADEGRNGEVAREMAATNDYVMPHLDGLPYLDKPVVFFAAAALAMEVLGPTETAARLPAFLFMVATALLTGWLARRLWGADAGWMAATITMAMPFTLAFSRTVIFDSALAFFIVLAIVSFYLAIEAGEARRVRTWRLLAWAAMAAGVLTKGPVAIAFPLLVCVPYAVWRKRGRVLWSLGGLVVFVAIIAPWVIAVSLQIPDFLQYVLVTETAQRLATNALKRTGPPWYFIPYLVGGALPWAVVPLVAWRAAFSRAGEGSRPRFDPELIFLVLWIAVPFVFFSISQSKRPQYILPIMPAVALLVTRMWRSPARVVAGARATGIITAVLGAALAGAAWMPSLGRHLKPELLEGARIAATGIGLAALGGGLIAALSAESRRTVVIALSLPVVAIPISAKPLLQAIGESRSTAAIARTIESRAADAEVIGVDAYESTLPFYLRRPVQIASEDGSELTSNYLIRHFDQWSARPDSVLHRIDFFETSLRTCCRPRVYFLRSSDAVRRSRLEAMGIPLLAGNGKVVAYGPYSSSKGSR